VIAIDHDGKIVVAIDHIGNEFQGREDGNGSQEERQRAKKAWAQKAPQPQQNPASQRLT
jgi:hypothetical protein